MGRDFLTANDRPGVHAASRFAESAAPLANLPPLEGEETADVAVIGGGCTGLPAALLARAGFGRAGLPTDMCVEDARHVLDYYRLSADGRMLFGGGTVYGGVDPADIEAKIRPNMERIFPTLKGVTIDYAWSGNRAICRRQPPLRAHPRRGGHGRSQPLRRLRGSAMDPLPRRAAPRCPLFRARVVVVRPPRPARPVTRHP